MDFEVYCDESYPDVLSSANPQAKFLVIGSLWLEASIRSEIKSAIHELRDKHKVGAEFKWRRISKSRLAFYNELVSLFFTYGDQLRFRCIAVEHQMVDLKTHHSDDQELGFYKFYYQLLKHWVLDYNRYAIFCDSKQNRMPKRLHTLQRYLRQSNIFADIAEVQAVRSTESVIIQFADVITGAVSARLNQRLSDPDSGRSTVVRSIERRLGKRISATGRSERKFNVFRIDLGGGW